MFVFQSLAYFNIMVSSSIYFLKVVVVSFSVSSVQFHFLTVVTSAPVNVDVQVSLCADLDPLCVSPSSV